jgi:hypothetical protein
MAEALPLKEQIDNLSLDQAQKAILNFYELLPQDWWAEKKKWATANIEIRASMVQQKAPTEIQPILSNLTNPGNELLKAAMAKTLLFEFSQYEETQPYVKQAVTNAREPQMLPIPIFIGAVLIVLALLPTKIKTEKVDKEFGNLKELASLAGSLKDIVDKFDLGKYLK